MDKIKSGEDYGLWILTNFVPLVFRANKSTCLMWIECGSCSFVHYCIKFAWVNYFYQHLTSINSTVLKVCSILYNLYKVNWSSKYQYQLLFFGSNRSSGSHSVCLCVCLSVCLWYFWILHSIFMQSSWNLHEICAACNLHAIFMQSLCSQLFPL